MLPTKSGPEENLTPIEKSYNDCSSLIEYIHNASQSEIETIPAERMKQVTEFIEYGENVFRARPTREQVLKAMGVVAEVLQVELPSDMACRIQADIIAENMSEPFLDQTTRFLMAHYKYRNFPNPADWRNAYERVSYPWREAVTLARIAHSRWRVYTMGASR